MDTNKYNSDCRFFLGTVPCRFHKKTSNKCYNCTDYQKIDYNILIIKLAAVGDVIRTTPLLHKLKSEHPNALIHWVTYTPEILPDLIDRKYKFNLESILTLEETHFDKAMNLDKDLQASALMNKISADEKFGFCLKNGMPAPCNELAKHKFVTGLFDDVNKSNTKSYLEEIFEICNYKFQGEEYILPNPPEFDWKIDKSSKVIGLNTGCGSRWVSRLWKFDYWVELINMLQKQGFTPLLLGGEQEDERNKQLASLTNAEYKGYFPLPKFISLVNECDLVVTAVTMGLHLAIGLKKQVVLMNNIFNPNEFELYGRGKIIQPAKECKCYFAPTCSNDDYFCLDSLTPQMIFEAIKQLI
ncbi:MAG: glycosyltransferase family 9 protein [Ignavibacteria bacterium]|nr:glycosyltransferase family 9 protein [Ignavibacteria bacterium]